MFELILISAAWRKGWRWRALLPTALAWPLVFVIANAGGAFGAIALIVIAELIALITMAVKAPANVPPAPVQPLVLELRYANERREKTGTGPVSTRR